MKNKNKTIKMSDIKIISVDGIEFDEIVGFAGDNRMTTIQYILNGKERTLSIESEAITIGFETDV